MSLALYERRGQIGVLTVNRPEALNSLNSEVIAALSERLTEIAKSDVRCLILTGAGDKAFVAGADVAQMKDMDAKAAIDFSNAGNAVMEQLENLPVPVIAAVNGFALGGGCELALSCDIRIASERAKFGQPEVGLGITPGFGGTQRLPRAVGLSEAMALILTGRTIDAAEALRIGLVHALHAPERLLDEAVLLAEAIAQNAPLAVRAAKRAMREGADLELPEGVAGEAELFAGCFATEDQKDAMAAFVEKRRLDDFKGK